MVTDYQDAVQLTGKSTKNKRRALDFYPTPPEVTRALMQFLSLPEYYTVWEPACGDGAMSEVLKEYVAEVVSTDVRFSGYGEGDVDFTRSGTWMPSQSVDAVITNPPFSTSGAFIQRALSISGTVAMLLKSQYWHAAKRQPLFEDTKPSFVLPLTWRPDFMGGERGGAPTMEVAWTVWVPGETQCRYVPLKRPT